MIISFVNSLSLCHTHATHTLVLLLSAYFIYLFYSFVLWCILLGCGLAATIKLNSFISRCTNFLPFAFINTAMHRNRILFCWSHFFGQPKNKLRWWKCNLSIELKLVCSLLHSHNLDRLFNSIKCSVHPIQSKPIIILSSFIRCVTYNLF